MKLSYKNSDKGGSALIIGLIIAAVVVVVGGAAFYISKSSSKDDNNISTSNQSADNKTSTRPIQSPSTKAQSLPADYPAKAAPIYKPSTTAMAMKMGNGWLVTVSSKDDVKDVAKSIKATYEKLGAKVDVTPFNDKGVGQLVASYGGYGSIITYNTDTDKNITSITYHVDPQAKR